MANIARIVIHTGMSWSQVMDLTIDQRDAIVKELNAMIKAANER